MRWVLWDRGTSRTRLLSAGTAGWGLGLVLVSGCFAPQSRSTEPDSGDPPSSGSQTAREVRLGSVSDGNQARLADVVVVGPVDRAEQRFFVQDLGGGPYSGLQVRMGPGVALPEVQEGDVLALTGNAVVTAGRFDLWLRSEAAAQLAGTGTPTPAVLDEIPREWGPWMGLPVTVADVFVTGCPVNDAVPTDLVPISGAWHDAGLGRGDQLEAVTGVVVPTGFEVSLWPRRMGDLEVGSERNGCSLSAEEAQTEKVVGEVELPRVVRTTPAATGGQTWVQDPGGDAGLLVIDLPRESSGVSLLAGVAVGQSVALAGELKWSGGRLVLTPHTAVPGDVWGAVDVRADALGEADVGRLVRVEDLTVGASRSYGAWDTDGGFVLDATFVRPLPVSDGQNLASVVGVVDRWPDGTLALLPRLLSDLSPGP